MSSPWLRGALFAGVNVLVIGLYGWVMSGRLEPLKHDPWTFVTGPLMVLTAIVSELAYPFLSRQKPWLHRLAVLYAAFLSIALLYGVYLGTIFPDVSPLRAIPLAILGAHLYGWPLFLLVTALCWALGGFLFSTTTRRS